MWSQWQWQHNTVRKLEFDASSKCIEGSNEETMRPRANKEIDIITTWPLLGIILVGAGKPVWLQTHKEQNRERWNPLRNKQRHMLFDNALVLVSKSSELLLLYGVMLVSRDSCFLAISNTICYSERMWVVMRRVILHGMSPRDEFLAKIEILRNRNATFSTATVSKKKISPIACLKRE